MRKLAEKHTNCYPKREIHAGFQTHRCALLMTVYTFRRYHKIGVLVLFLHDINDIQLEFTKLNVYLKNSGGAYRFINEIITTCISFSITW